MRPIGGARRFVAAGDVRTTNKLRRLLQRLFSTIADVDGYGKGFNPLLFFLLGLPFVGRVGMSCSLMREIITQQPRNYPGLLLPCGMLSNDNS